MNKMTGKKQSRYALIDDSPGGVCSVIDIQNTMPTILFQSKKQALKFINHLQQQEKRTQDLEKKLKRCREWMNSDKYDYELTLAFIKNKGYSLQDVLEYKKTKWRNDIR